MIFDDDSNTMEFWQQFKQTFDEECNKIFKTNELKVKYEIKSCCVKIERITSVFKNKTINKKCKLDIRRELRPVLKQKRKLRKWLKSLKKKCANSTMQN